MELNPGISEPEKAPVSRKRGGRPSAGQAGEVDRRILDAATTLFLRSGFDATSCDQVLALAGAGKATLYARYANKDALFSAVVRRMVEQRMLPEADVAWDRPARERLRLVGTSCLRHALTAESVALMRVCISTADRLPELARLVERMGRGDGVASVARALAGQTSASGKVELATAVAERFVDMAIMPQQMRALIGADHGQLTAAALCAVDDAIDLLARAGLLDAFDGQDGPSCGRTGK